MALEDSQGVRQRPTARSGPGPVATGQLGSCRKGLLQLVVYLEVEQEISPMTLGVHFFVLGTRGSRSSPSRLLSTQRHQVQSCFVLPQVQACSEGGA